MFFCVCYHECLPAQAQIQGIWHKVRASIGIFSSGLTEMEDKENWLYKENKKIPC